MAWRIFASVFICCQMTGSIARCSLRGEDFVIGLERIHLLGLGKYALEEWLRPLVLWLSESTYGFSSDNLSQICTKRSTASHSKLSLKATSRSAVALASFTLYQDSFSFFSTIRISRFTMRPR